MKLSWIGLTLTATTFCCFGGDTTLPLGSSCADRDRCAAGLICQYGRCRNPCNFDSDCPDSMRCVDADASAGTRVCSLPDENPCDIVTCPAGYECVAGSCQETMVHGDADADIDGDTDADTDADVDADEEGSCEYVEDCASGVCCYDLDDAFGPGICMPECRDDQVQVGCRVPDHCQDSGQLCCAMPLTPAVSLCTGHSSCADALLVCEDMTDCPLDPEDALQPFCDLWRGPLRLCTLR